ncbi:sensor histidine kinase [Desulfosarcina ovata]|uniref:histidine kinase n=1 Tax=Desulfosarcina ovata subsp. ovata TaxID=2752305 RepID=A0A5K8AC30_9BACT|nr:sensor histidine kinase [Desulfosarcina ovata]BBO90059.1 hypothetical protein DSCOOX_32390 [Desulfosarcina ovata subsp. ovata]
MLPFVILGIAATSAVLMWTNYRYFQKTVDQDYRNIIRASASEIDLFMDNATEDMETLAWLLRAVRFDNWRAEMVLSAFQYSKPKFGCILLVFTDGRCIPASGDDSPENQASAAGVIEKAFSGLSAISEVDVGDDNLPLVHMAVPVRRMGRIEAALYGRLNLKHIWDVLEGIRIGDTGQIFILDPSGRHLAHREIDRVVSGLPGYGSRTLHAIKDSPFPVKWIEHVKGKGYFCLGVHLTGQDWVVVLRQAMPEIYAYLHANFIWAVTITAAACLLAVMLGWFQVKQFIRPIETMHKQVLQIGDGRLDLQVAVKTNDEIGDLGRAFNTMTASLNETIDREIRTARKLAHARNLALLGISASKVTHEVGNLLNNVGMSASALKGEPLSRKGTLALEKMETEAARIKTFLLDFLKFAKPPELHPSPVALDLVLREVLAMHKPVIRQRGIEVSMDWPPDAPRVQADASLLYQAFNNLVKNSIEALDGDGRVAVRGTIDGTWLEVSVEDNGCGIAPEHRERMFEPFFTTKGKVGNGLGMAIVQSIVTAHRGTITCQSQPGQGTHISIRIPIK